MFKIFLYIISGIFLGWSLHTYFTALNPKIKVIKKECDNIEPEKIIIREIEPQIVVQEVMKFKSSDLNGSSPFEKLLKRGEFKEALKIYIDESNETKLSKYKSSIKLYFKSRVNRYPNKTIEEILEFIDVEVNSEDIKLYLAKLYIDREEFLKAIKLLFELRDNQEIESMESVNSNLDNAIKKYILRLKANEDFQTLITFLEDMINQEENSQRYIIELAKVYVDLNRYEKAKGVLADIESDTVYSKRAETILSDIEQKEENAVEYTHKIPLKKVGSQYGIDVTIDGVLLRLLLDTGATYTFIDEQKIPSLELESEMILNTAGGEIRAYTAHASSFMLDNIELRNFKIVIAPFSQNGLDGLLGMNFFKKFNFKIDQTENLLYLKRKVTNF